MRIVRFVAAVLIVMSPVTTRAAEAPLAGFADLVERLSPAVVNISTSQKVKGGQIMMQLPDMPNSPEMDQFRKFFEQFGQEGGDAIEREVTSLGSGFIIDPAGFIITNNHVIDESEDITVRLNDDTKYKAKIVGRDKKTDLALLKVEAKKPLPAVTFGDSDAMRVGDWVIAIGNPFGLGGSVTQGIISARQRSINAGPFDDFLQTDAPINRGSSGGPLFNLKGEVIGINSAIFSPSGGNVGIGFAIPASLAKPVIAQLKEFGRTHRGWLGVKIQQVSEEIADSVGLPAPKGALVLETSKDSPAGKAGIQDGDIILTFDGKEVTQMRFLPRLVAETQIGRSVPVTVWRKGKEVALTVKIGEMDEQEEAKEDAKAETPVKKDAATPSQRLLGLEVSALTPQLREQFSIAEGKSGLAVVDVTKGSEAAHRGIRAGDLVTEVANEPVKSIEEATRAVEAAKKAGRNYVLLKVERDKNAAFIALPIAEEKK